MVNASNPQRPWSVTPPDSHWTPADETPAQSDEVSEKSPPPTAGALGEFSSALMSARSAFLSFLELMSLETRRASLALMWMITWGMVAAICIVSAWLGLMVVLALWASSLGFPLIGAVIAIAVINVVAGAALIRVCFGMSRYLLFSATRRQLAGELPVDPAAS